MGYRNTFGMPVVSVAEAETAAEASAGVLQALLATPVAGSAPQTTIGRLLAIAKRGRQPLVTYPGHPGSGALTARTTVDLHAPHIGRDVLLVFEDADPLRPIVIGVLRDGASGTPVRLPGAVQLSSDGERLIVSARDQLVLRCGMASITLTSDGKVMIDGEQVTSRARGANWLRGGSVQLN